MLVLGARATMFYNNCLLVLVGTLIGTLVSQFNVHAADECRHFGGPDDACGVLGRNVSFRCLSSGLKGWSDSMPDEEGYRDVASAINSYVTEYNIAQVNIDGQPYTDLTVIGITSEMHGGLFTCTVGEVTSCPAELQVASKLTQDLVRDDIVAKLTEDEGVVTANVTHFKATPGIKLKLVVNGNDVKETPPPDGCPQTEAGLVYPLTEEELDEDQKLNIVLLYSHPTLTGQWLTLGEPLIRAPTTDEPSKSKAMYIGIGAVVVLFIIIFISVCCYRRRKKKKPKPDTAERAEQRKAKELLQRDKPPPPKATALALDDLNLSKDKKPEHTGLLRPDTTDRDSDDSRYSAHQIEEKLRKSDRSHGASDNEEDHLPTYSTHSETDRHPGDHTYQDIDTYPPPPINIVNTSDSDDSPSVGTADRSPTKSEDSWVDVGERRRNYAVQGDGGNVKAEQPIVPASSRDKAQAVPSGKTDSEAFHNFMEDLSNKSSGKQYK